MNEDNNNSLVQYTVKEILAKMDAKIDTILSQLEQKAEKIEVVAILSRLDIAERELIKLNTIDLTRVADQDRYTNRGRHLMGLVLPISVSSLMTLLILVVPILLGTHK